MVTVVVRRFGIRVQTAAYDATNVFTDVPIPTPGGLARRGQHQQQRKRPPPGESGPPVDSGGSRPPLASDLPRRCLRPAGVRPRLARLPTRDTEFATLPDGRITGVFDQGHVSQATILQGWERAWVAVSMRVPGHHNDRLAVPRIA